VKKPSRTFVVNPLYSFVVKIFLKKALQRLQNSAIIPVKRNTKMDKRGCWLLVIGCWLLVAGYWLLVTGDWLLVTGCWFDLS